jgi:hypothetical protein
MESLCIAADLRMYTEKNNAKNAALRATLRAAAPRALDDPLMMRLRSLPEQPAR